ncbi:MAG: MurT ligase domain-containing protein [Actinomycetes bacterium]
MAGGLSRAARRGNGTTISGRVALVLDPQALSRLARGRRSAVVSGTNGKTTTTRLLAEALRTHGMVAHNDRGANMPTGLVACLARDVDAPLAALEVDEPWLPTVVAAVDPRVVVLLNLSRDQLDRVGEVALLAHRWRAALAVPRSGSVVVANADDPHVAWAAMGADRVAWVAAGQAWRADSVLCPACSRLLARVGQEYSCRCGFRRPRVGWRLVDDPGRDGGDAGTYVRDPDGRKHRLDLSLPGRVNQSNALIAVAAAAQMGVAVDEAAAAMARVREIAGRYARVDLAGRALRLLLAKNPAGWAVALDLLRPPAECPTVVVAVNARAADGRDPSWLWDVPFEALGGRHVLVAGDRRADVAVRLAYAGVELEIVDGGVAEAARRLGPGSLVDVLANYTAFDDALAAAGGRGTASTPAASTPDAHHG